MWNGMDRRRFARSEYPCLITLRKNVPPKQSILTHTENISLGGVEVVIAKKISPATEVDLEIDLKDTLENVFAKGIVCWVKEVSAKQRGKTPRYDTGVQFVGLKEADRQRIEHIVSRFLDREN